MSEVETLSQYGDTGGSDVNRDLREGHGMSETFAARMDAIFARAAPLAEPLVAFRGVSTLPGDDRANDPGARLRRVFGRDSVVAGDVFSDRAFMSLTLDDEMASRFAGSKSVAKVNTGIILELSVPKGARVLKGREDETEVILPRNTKFRVSSVKEGAKVKGYEHIVGPLRIRAEVVL